MFVSKNTISFMSIYVSLIPEKITIMLITL